MSHPIRVLVLAPFRARHMDRLRQAAGDRALIVQADGKALDDERLLRLLAQSDVVIGEPEPSLLAKAPRVRWVQMTWAGSDLYTQAETTFPQGVRLTNVAGYAFGHIISQFVVGQILAVAQNLSAYVRQQERGLWERAGGVATLEGATVLVFGAGDIGSSTAKRLAGFDCRCVGVCRTTAHPRPFFEHLVTLDEAECELPKADVVVNCLPHDLETAGWMNERRLRMMKQGSILVNVGRGSFVDCDALACVLAEGHLRGAALDVTNPEPLPEGHPLWHEPRCIVTPHVAGGSFGACDITEDRICDVCCDNLTRWLAGDELTHVVM